MTIVASITFALMALVLVASVHMARIALRARARTRCTSPPVFVGLEGWSESPLEPIGHVIVRGELWEAVADAPAPRGAPVRVVGADGTRLRVARIRNTTEATR
jgi:membrane-bound serine protease (ClpP class)